eukprot:TRINITY_DN5587_c0_g1_i1.p1 TRINITY_DN5587_c0_g1~~TRINITY_DN5587_c0_g1_i1.p1  ORF type:complete len:165 (-),score=14.90 TRINITY_DN5587_c0_g1_i1:371-865(-)
MGQQFTVRRTESPPETMPSHSVAFVSNRFIVQWIKGELLRDETTDDGQCCSAAAEKYDTETRYKIYANDATSRLIDFALKENFDENVYLAQNEGRSWSIVVRTDAVKNRQVEASFACVVGKCTIELRNPKTHLTVVAITYTGENMLKQVTSVLPQAKFISRTLS